MNQRISSVLPVCPSQSVNGKLEGRSGNGLEVDDRDELLSQLGQAGKEEERTPPVFTLQGALNRNGGRV